MEDEPGVQRAEDLDRLSMTERHRVVAASITTDLEDVDPAFVARARRRGRELLAERGLDLPPA